MSTHWLVPGMYYPLWILHGDVAKNVESDTDMGDLSLEEFHSYFPEAVKITEAQFTQALERLPALREDES